MRSANDVCRAISPTAAALALSCVSTAQVAVPLPPSPPPIEFEASSKRPSAIQTSYEDLGGAVEYSMRRKLVHLTWRRDFSSYLPETTHPPSLTPDGGFVSLQDEPVGFWPTEVCGFGEDRVCVAGKTSKGKTRIEVWTFNTDETLDDPFQVPPGVFKYPDTFLTIESKETVYNDARPGRMLVRTMFRNHGNPDSLFVQFGDERELYELDTISGALSVVVSLQQEPLLANDFHDRWSAHHTLGYMYAVSFTGGDALLLFDSNFDGTLDLPDRRFLTGDDWDAGLVDFSDPAGYVAHY